MMRKTSRALYEAELTTRGGTRKRKKSAVLFGSVPKKAKNPTATTRRKEAAAKAAKFQKLPKAPPMVSVYVSFLVLFFLADSV